MSQVYFAMLCDLRRHGFTLREYASGRRSGHSRRGGTNASQKHSGNNRVFHQYPSIGPGYILVPELGLNISHFHSVVAASRYCAAREADLQALKRASRANFSSGGHMLGAYCAPFWEAVARDYDVVIANVGDISYAMGDEKSVAGRMVRARLLHDVQATVEVLHGVAHANASKVRAPP